MDQDYTKGHRLFVETAIATVEGVFHSMDPGRNRLTLNKVVLHPSGKKMEGLYHYYRNEIISVRVLEPDSRTGVNKEDEAAGNSNLMKKTRPVLHSDRAPGKIMHSDVVSNYRRGHGCRKQTAMNRNKMTEEEYDALNKLVRDRVLISRLGDVFKQAVGDIRAEPVVGFSVEGAMFGRYSKVSLLSFATPSRAFVFDICSLGNAAFDNGLRDILETEDIEKVIHNCRLVSDCLHHKHHVTISNVFDTQVADLMVTRGQWGEFPRTVRSLPQCLTRYLHLPNNLLHHPQIRDGYVVCDAMEWYKRPLPVALEVVAVKNCIFLLHLQKKVREALMRPFCQCVDVFLNLVRDMDQDEASEYQACDALVPSELLSLSLNDQLIDDQNVLHISA